MRTVSEHRIARAALVSCIVLTTAPLFAEAPPTTAPAGVDFNFPDAIPLRTLVDYVSRRLGVNIVYDADLAKPDNVVTIRSPRGLPSDSLLPLLRSVLRTKGFDLVDGEQPGWSQIVKVDAAAPASPGPPVVQFVTLKHAAANRVAQQVKQLLTSVYSRGGPSTTQPAPAFDVIYDDRTNQLGAMGPADVVAEALRVADSIDVAVPTEAAPIRFYKLTNATAADVLDTIRELHGKPRLGRATPDAAARSASTDGVAPRAESAYSNTGGSNAGSVGGIPAQSSPPVGLTASPTLGGSGAPIENARGSNVADASAADRSVAPGDGLLGVTADANTNTIIVMGGPEMQARYSTLIKELDKRRPQVLLEATIVTLDTTNSFSLGVDIAARGASGGSRVITFSQFGLSTPNTDTGHLTIVPGTGFNGAIVAGDVADVIVQALAVNSRARVQSAPRILVNDNATGTLSSVAEQPFTSTNASTTVATTSFGGYAEAGTTIALTPHISDDDYLQLEYAVELSNFTGSADAASGSPPPRQTNKVESKVTIPDGSTIIVGGLNRSNYTRTKNSIPLLGDIPILQYLFSNRSESNQQTTLFVFLRPIILRDDKFQDLKNLSERDVKRAGIPGDFPQSSTLLIRDDR